MTMATSDNLLGLIFKTRIKQGVKVSQGIASYLKAQFKYHQCFMNTVFERLLSHQDVDDTSTVPAV